MSQEAKVAQHVPPRRAPGPRGHFLAGNIFDFKRDIQQALARGQREHGDVVRYRLGHIVVHGVSHPDLAEEVLVGRKNVYVKLGKSNPLSLVLGDGLLTNADHESWFRQRKMMQPIFHRHKIGIMFDKMLACSERMLDRWAANPPDQPLDMMTEMMAVTLDIVSQTMFSANIMNDQAAIGPDSVNITIDYAFKSLQNPFSPPLSWPTPGNRRFRRVVKALDALMYRLIAERRALGEPRNDLLDMLLAAQDEETGQKMSDKELRDEMLTMLAAGHETTGISLTWTLYLLSQHPEIVRRLQEEVDRVLGGRAPTLADLPTLPYALQVFEEAMRLYPVALLIPRRTSQAATLGGYDLPAGSRILVSLYNLHRHPQFWPDPDTFDPGRFTTEKKKQQHRYAYMPFGAGQHICIGNNMALMIGQLLLTLIYRRFDVRHAPGHRVERHATLTLRPRYGMDMTLHPRDRN